MNLYVNKRYFSQIPPSGGQGGPQGGPNDDGYSTEEDNTTFDKERRFSNFIMFLGSFSMLIIFLASNVVQFKR